ncbi:guanine nucleotide-binding protein alpha-2 subunit [Rickenella mellea]|uniref:Guanine nucleotide-binding protein alpha-2 subunit n=1 Tax=Rickenella mellea TaxID=50990 RepID=A0A4Y7Q595_9AGAM|nr:guanine nucleotide-binding protein alpha-2 subunit [Rickenella mellea]
MGACISSGEVTEEEKRRHQVAERELKEAKAKLAAQVKVLLLGSGDSGKSTILKQMRLIHNVNFSQQEFESYRQLVFNNLTQGMKSLIDALDDMGLEVSDDNQHYISMIEDAPDLKDSQEFPMEYYEPLKSLWEDENVQKGWQRGNEAALPDNLSYFFPDLDRLFDSNYYPTEQDIIRCRARTIGITETIFNLRNHEMLMVDVGGQKSERRKWIHCFQDVTSILFLVSLSGYDQCLVEDKDANQMQDAMTIWDSICHSQWFNKTSIILFLNKDDIFRKKILHSDIKTHFPDYEGEPGNAEEGRQYFKSRFTKLSRKSGQARERELYVHFTNATDTALLRVVMAAVEGSIALRANLTKAALI